MGTTSNQVLLLSMTSMLGSYKTTEEEKPLEKALCKCVSDAVMNSHWQISHCVLLTANWLYFYFFPTLESVWCHKGDIPYMFMGPTHLDSILLSTRGSQSEDSQLKGMETRARTISDRGTASRPRIRQGLFWTVSHAKLLYQRPVMLTLSWKWA